MELINGSIINVQAYKHDGTLYKQWNGVKVIEITSKQWILYMFKTKVSKNTGQKWDVREPIIWWFDKNKFYNTTGLLRPEGTLYYTNIASPPIYEDNVIKYIDYDIDIKSYPNKLTKIMDRNEYKRNSITYEYSDKLKKIIDKNLKYILNKVKLKEGYFNKKNVNIIIKKLEENNLI